MIAVEVEEREGGSPAVRVAANRIAFEATIARACDCPLEIRVEHGNLVECARCSAPIYARRPA